MITAETAIAPISVFSVKGRGVDGGEVVLVYMVPPRDIRKHTSPPTSYRSHPWGQPLPASDRRDRLEDLRIDRLAQEPDRAIGERHHRPARVGPPIVPPSPT